MKKQLLSFLFCSLLLSAAAQIRLPRLISNGMILQREAKVKIWGWANPGDSVNVWLSNFGRKL